MSQIKEKIADQAITVIPTILKFAGILIVAGVAIRMYKNRFVKSNFDPKQPPANISVNEARTRANSLFQAMYGWGANFDLVRQNLSGLNYNGWIMLFNEFGQRKGTNVFGAAMTLDEWIVDQFKGSELQQLRFLLPFNAF